jgi:hypothetical protein
VTSVASNSKLSKSLIQVCPELNTAEIYCNSYTAILKPKISDKDTQGYSEHVINNFSHTFAQILAQGSLIVLVT